MASPDFTVADVLAWARTKPADERYNYGSINNCALCQFLRETRRAADPRVGGTGYRDAAVLGERNPIPNDIADALVDNMEWTFGALVRRLEAIHPEILITPNNWSAIDAYMADIEQVQA